jgi:hypothetical protein
MRRTIRSVVGAALVLIGGAVLAQAPAPAPAGSDLFPLKLKSKWVYKVGDQTVEVVAASTEKVGTDECTKLDTVVGGKVQASELVCVKADGVYRVKVKEDKVDPPVKILPLPAKKDTAWKVDFKVGSSAVKGDFKVKEEKEKVKVEAGDFETVVVDGPDLDIAGTKSSVRYWFAPGKGIVKLEYVIQNNKAELELKSYTEGK